VPRVGGGARCLEGTITGSGWLLSGSVLDEGFDIPLVLHDTFVSFLNPTHAYSNSGYFFVETCFFFSFSSRSNFGLLLIEGTNYILRPYLHRSAIDLQLVRRYDRYLHSRIQILRLG
jgi:hypothetical protein